MSEFAVPAKPWGEAELKFLHANERLLDNETRAELGLEPSEDAPKEAPKAEEVVEEVVEEAAEEVEEEKSDA